MVKQSVVFHKQEDLVDFVNKMCKYQYDADLVDGISIIDAKSILGVLGLGLERNLSLHLYHDDDNSEILSQISDYLVSSGK